MLRISKTKLRGFYKLTRIKTIMEFYPITVLLGIFGTRTFINFNSILTSLSIFLILVSAFIINDIADAEDDAKDPAKINRNPISAGIISKKHSNNFYIIICLLGTLPLLLINLQIFIVGLTLTVIGYFYSAKPIRLKSRLLLDILSHGFFLAAGEVIIFGLLPGSTLDVKAYFAIAGSYLFSMGGDLYNEVRDWTVDREVGLKNTAYFIGYNPSRYLSYVFYVLGVIFAILASIGIIFKL